MNLNFRPVGLRKIGGSFYISVPPVWVDNLGLEVGMEIDRRLESNGDLILSPVGQAKESRR